MTIHEPESVHVDNEEDVHLSFENDDESGYM